MKMPVKDDLTHGSFVLSGKFLDDWFLKNIQLLVLLSLEWPCEGTKWSVSSNVDSQLLLEVNILLLDEVWMELDLVDCWLNLAVGQDIE